jgi:hypothetical protein
MLVQQHLYHELKVNFREKSILILLIKVQLRTIVIKTQITVTKEPLLIKNFPLIHLTLLLKIQFIYFLTQVHFPFTVTELKPVFRNY